MKKKLIPKTKKSKIVALLTVLAVALIGTVVVLKIFAANAQISLTSSASSVNKDDTFVVTVNATTGGEAVNAGEAYITFDPSKVSYVSTDYTGSSFTSDTPDAAVGAGFVKISRYSLPPFPTGNITYGKITFKALASSGSIPISVDQTKSSMYNVSASSDILTGVSNVTVTVTPPVTPPTELPGQISIAANPTSVQTDGTFVVTVNGNSNTVPIKSAGAYITYDPSKVSYVSTDYAGSGFTQDAAGAGIGVGFVNLQRSTSTNIPTGTFVIGKITFKAVAAGSASFGVTIAQSSLTSNTTNDDILASANTAAVTVTAPTPTPDTTAPSAPTNLIVTSGSSTQLNLSWNASTDNVGVTGYQVFRGTQMLAGNVTGTTYSNGGLTEGTQYTYTVKAVDAAGNVSAASSQASATTPTVADTTAPSAPNGLTAAIASSAQVNLSWTGSTDNVAVNHYVVYRDGQVLSAANHLTQTTFSDMTVASGTTYKYTVKAVDAAGNTSAASNEAQVETPVPIPPLTTGGDTTPDPPVVVPITPTPTTPVPVVTQGTTIQPRVNGTTSSGKPVAKTDFFVNNNYVGTSTGANDPVTIDTSKLDPGPVSINAKSQTTDGSIEESTQEVTITKPSIFARFGAPIVFSIGIVSVTAFFFVLKMLYAHLVPFYKTI